MYLYLKAFHIIFIVTWFAGLFYIVRLFIYHVEANKKQSPEKEILQKQFALMEKRLWYVITWPSCVLSFILGMILLTKYTPHISSWLFFKLALVFLLFMYHLYCGNILKQLKTNTCRHTSNWLRIWNEVATLLLFSIVLLAVLKNSVQSTIVLCIILMLAIILFFSIRIYAKKRLKNS